MMILTLLSMVFFFGWNHESCMRGYFKHFSCGNAKKIIVKMVKKKQKKTTDIVLASRKIQALVDLLLFIPIG